VRFPPTTGIVETVDESSCVLTTGADSATLIALHLALLGHDFAVLQPTELIDELKVLADRLHHAHQASTAQRGETR
jgi:predicted DNA-binding transcriptional regulator YafY